MWSASLIQIQLILPLTVTSTMINSILMALAMLLSLQFILHVAITSYIWNVAPCEVICFAAPKFVIYLHTLLECAPSRFKDAQSSSSFAIRIFGFFVLYFLVKTRNVAQFAAIEAHPYALTQKLILPFALTQLQ